MEIGFQVKKIRQKANPRQYSTGAKPWGNTLENSLSYIQENYPELSVSVFEDHAVFEGRFLISAKYKEHEIDIAPRLKILFPKSYPLDFPVVFDVLNAYPSDHRLENKGLCVATPLF